MSDMTVPFEALGTTWVWRYIDGNLVRHAVEIGTDERVPGHVFEGYSACKLGAGPARGRWYGGKARRERAQLGGLRPCARCVRKLRVETADERD